MKKNYFEIILDTEDIIEGIASQHVDIIEEIMPAVYVARGMKDIEFTGSMRVGCYIDGDCAYAQYKCKASVLTIKKVCGPSFEMDICPYCDAEYETPLFTLDTYKPKAVYICPHCGRQIQMQFEQKKIDLNSFTQKNERKEVCFGSFDMGESNEKKPLEWIVLEEKNDKMLLLSKYGVYCAMYDTADDENPHMWHTSAARKLLNNEFYIQAFSAEEQKRIELSVLENKGVHNVSDGPETEDRIFLLSNEEVKRYLKPGADSKAKPLDKANEKGNWRQWWTRTPGENNCSASLVDDKGRIDDSGLYYDDSSMMLRPAMWVTMTT